VPDKYWGEAVRAAVVARPGFSVTEAELQEHCRASLGGYKIPKAIDLRSEALPKSGAGKILKRDLRAPFWEGRGRGIHGTE
jgi:acyl-CoA synthetase (AMP-forming)/AMP-acid ligase II